MDLRPSSELIQSLRATLQKIEENFSSVENEPNVAELKRILLQRIAEIEAINALQGAEASEARPEPMGAAREVHPDEPVFEQSLES